MSDKTAQPEKRKQAVVIDPELDLYRNMIPVPTTFKEGFSWLSVAGACFCGLLMFPGSIYLGLLLGSGMGPAGVWVTVIVFSEITRRALKSMSKEETVILLSVAGGMVGGSGPFGDLIYRQFLVTSDAVRDAGLYGQFPAWFAPAPDSTAISGRSFIHRDWLLPIGYIAYMTVIGMVNHLTLGYGLFRLTSDIEKLPFPMAPISAQGALALTEGEAGERTTRWTVFSIGTMLGLAWGVIAVGVPAVSSAFLAKPITILPIPFLDTTTVTESILPATPTGLVIDLGLVLVGMIIPFWAIVGSTFSVLITFIMHPILHKTGMLPSWRPGMDTINTQIANSMDFYFSIGLGVAFGMAVVSVFQTIKQLRVSFKELREKRAAALASGAPPEKKTSILDTPPGRGDWSLKLCVVGFLLASTGTVVACKLCVPEFNTWFLILFAFVYTPLISYFNARLAGIAGQHVDIPFLREAFILASGVKGVTPWLAPIPLGNLGGFAQAFRTKELTGVKFTSGVKASLLVTPLVFIFSFVFWSFLWKDSPIPSDLYPYAQKMWDLQARSTMIMWTATTGQEGTVTLFDRSWHPNLIYVGMAFSIIAFTVLSLLNMPTLLVYGMIRGLGSQPHGLILELLGAFIGRYYFMKRFGKERFLQNVPILLAGYYVGTGLIGMAGIALRLIMSAISPAPF